MEKPYKFVTSIGGLYLAVLHPSKTIFGVLILVNMVDYLTGILKAVSIGERIDVEKSFSGIVKKINKLGYVVVSLTADILITTNFCPDKPCSPISGAVLTWLVINELVSICSNVSNNESLDIPPMIRKFLEKFKEVYND